MLLVPSSILNVHDLNAPARNFCANPLRVGIMRLTPFVFCCCWSAFRIVDVSAANHIPSYTTNPRSEGKANSRMLIETTSISLLIYLG